MNRVLTALLVVPICAPAMAQTLRIPTFDGVTITGTATSTFPTPTAGDNSQKPATTGFSAAAVAAEAARATGVEATKAATTALTSETTRATTAEQAAQATANAAATPANVTAAVATEAARATGAEGTNATAIGAEATTARAAEALALPKAGGTISGPLVLNGKTTLNGYSLHLPAVNARAPTPNDSVATGYNLGSYWNAPQGTYQLARSTAGAAAWLANDASVTMLPLDILPGSIAAYGTRKLRNAYAGSAIQVTRASDSTAASIGFVGVVLDTATLDTFCLNTTCAITLWYDQSGNAYNATAPASTSPHIVAGNLIGNSRSILFDSTWNGTVFTPASFMTLPNSIAATFNNSSAIFLARTRNIEHAPQLMQWTNASTSIGLGSQTPSPGNLAVTIAGVGQFGNHNSFMSATPYVAGYNSGVANFQDWRDDNVFQTGVGTGNSNPLAGGFLGSSPTVSAATGYSEMAAAIFYPFSMTEPQRQELTASLHWNFQTIPQARANWVVDGDSITDGYTATSMQNYPRLAERLLQKPMNITNVALYGDTLAGRNASYTSNTAPLFITGAADNVVSIFAATNDLASGAQAAAIEASMTSYCGQARATGFKILVATALPRQGFSAGQETQRQAFNAWLRANYTTFADGMADVDADPTMGALSAVSNAALYTDGTHPTTLGYSYLAPIFAAAVNSLLTP